MLAGVGAKLPCAGHLLYLRHSTVNSGDALNHPRQAFMTKFSFRMGLSVHARLAWLRAKLYLGWWAQLLTAFQRRLRLSGGKDTSSCHQGE